MNEPRRRLVFLPTPSAARIRAAGSPFDLVTTFHLYFQKAHVSLGDGQPWLSDLACRWRIGDLLDELAGQGALKALAPAVRQPGLRDKLAELLIDLKQRGVKPADLDRLAVTGEGPVADLAVTYAAYRERVRDFADLPWQVVHALNKGDPLPAWLLGFSDVVVEGIDLLTVHQRGLLEALVKRGLELHFAWPLPQRVVEGLPLLNEQHVWLQELERQAAGRVRESFAADHSDTGALPYARRSFPAAADPLPAPDDSIQLLAAPGELAEVDLVARRIRSTLEADPSLKPEQVAVVIRDMTTYRPLILERFGRVGLPVQMRRGLTLVTSPLYRYVRALHGLPGNDFEARAVLAVVQSNYCKSKPRIDGDELERLLGELRYLDEKRTPLQRQLERFLSRQKVAAEDPSARAEKARDKAEGARRAVTGVVRFFARLRQLSRGDIGPPVLNDCITHYTHLGGDEALLRRDEYVLGTIREQIDGIGRAATEWRGEPKLPLARWLEAMDEEARHATVRVASAGEGVAVLSVQDLRGQRFRHVYAVGLQENGFPRRPSIDPLLRDAVRRELSDALRAARLPALPDVSWWAEMERVHFARVLWAAEERLVASLPVTAENQREEVPGAFFADLADLFRPDADGPTTLPFETASIRELTPPLEACACRDDLHTRLALDLFLPASRLADTFSARHAAEERAAREQRLALGVYARLREREPEHLARWLRAAAVERARAQTLSQGLAHHYAGAFAGESGDRVRQGFVAGPDIVVKGSQLETFGQCPFRFLAGAVLNLQPLETPGEGVSGLDRGSVVHRVLERFGRTCREPVDPVRHVDLIMQLAEEEIGRLLEDGLLAAEEMLALERVALRNLLGRFLHVEAAVFAEHGWRTALVEYVLDAVHLEIAHTPSRRTGFRVHGRIDRVDAAGRAGRPRVVDYKSSARRHDDDEFRLGTALQVALYALALEHEDPARLQEAGWTGAPSFQNVAGAYYSLRRRSVEVIQALGFFDEPDWRQTLHDHLLRYAEAFQKAEFPVHPTEGACDYCPYLTLCRRTEGTARRSLDAGAKEDEE